MVILGLGSNLSSSFGDRFKNIELALSALNNYGIIVIKRSSFYETPSFPNNKNPKFINIIVEVITKLPPVDLASVLIFIEESLERTRSVKNDPRTCDIDIIDYANNVMSFKYKNHDFVVPHEKLTFRNFVLYPLQEIKPEWKHPETKKSISTLIDELPLKDKKLILKLKNT